MSKVIYIRLNKAGARTGPFDIYTLYGDVIATNVPRVDLVKGVNYTVDNNVEFVKIRSVGKCFTKCTGEAIVKVGTAYTTALIEWKFTNFDTASAWRHLTNPVIYNYFYNNIDPYIVEYPFAYQYNDEILQNVKDFTRAYKYLPSNRGVWDDSRKIETDDRWFNKAVLYNGQQSSGVLELVPKPKNNMAEYMKYPIYGTESKTITYTKSDNFYQYNTFWSLVKDKSIPLFVNECCYALSLDKVVNQSNMDYGKRSFKKEPLRAKYLRVRHILDNRYDAHLVSQFTVAPSQISYK